MRLKLVFLTGMAILLFSAPVFSPAEKSEAKSLVVKLVRAPAIDRQGFLLIKDAIEKAGHSTYLPEDADTPGRDASDVGISVMPIGAHQTGEMPEDAAWVVHYDNKLLAQCINKELSRRISLNVSTFEKKLPFLQQEIPAVVIKVHPESFEDHSVRYAKGIAEGIVEYADEL
jgi:hypothetical protein